ncbi:MAG TPA: hypothetical protein DCM86_15415 [Verrucomicrobiales bacterium]|nr:hypothetical protein [Verrucomicrobiales bacterium]
MTKRILPGGLPMIAAAALILLLTHSPTAAFGQLPGGGGSDPSSFNPALLQLFGGAKAFSGRVNLRVTDQGNKETMRTPMTLVYLENKVRVEVNLGDMVQATLPPQAIAMFKQAGMDQVTSILRPDRKQAIICFPAAKIYTQEGMSPSDLDAFNSTYDVKFQEIGNESLEGHPCTKCKFTVGSSSGKTMQGTVWRATDLKNFPVRIQVPAPDSTLEMTFKEIKTARPEAAQFEAPGGFKRFDNMEKLMTERMSSILGGGAPQPRK